ncbi:MAG: RNA polymerase sigma factor [Proteobacteria bacterium]|nr:RNA polymerase sigma factor [Pseudomonadota bacterium]
MTDSITAPTDACLMARLAEGNMDALGQLYRRYGAMVASALRRFAPHMNETEIEDLLQDVFLSLKDLAVKYVERSRFRSWLYGVSVQAARNWKKKGSIRTRLILQHQGERLGISLAAEISPEGSVITRDLISRSLAQLPVTQQEVLLLHEVDGFSGDEIGEILHISTQAVWMRLHRARRTLIDSVKRREQEALLNEDNPLMLKVKL